MTEFKAGDRVELRDGSSDDGREMTVTWVDDGGRVGLTDGSWNTSAPPQHLRRVDEPRGFKAGDRVRVTDGHFCLKRGHEAVVDGVTYDGVWVADNTGKYPEGIHVARCFIAERIPDEPANEEAWEAPPVIRIEGSVDGINWEKIEQIARENPVWSAQGYRIEGEAARAIATGLGVKPGTEPPIYYVGDEWPRRVTPKQPTVTHTFRAVLPDGRTVTCPEPGEGWRCVGEVSLAEAFPASEHYSEVLTTDGVRSAWREMCDVFPGQLPREHAWFRWERIPRESYHIPYPLLHEPAIERAPSAAWPESGRPPRYVQPRRGDDD